MGGTWRDAHLATGENQGGAKLEDFAVDRKAASTRKKMSKKCRKAKR
jgi:hypothetical protein